MAWTEHWRSVWWRHPQVGASTGGCYLRRRIERPGIAPGTLLGSQMNSIAGRPWQPGLCECDYECYVRDSLRRGARGGAAQGMRRAHG